MSQNDDLRSAILGSGDNATKDSTMIPYVLIAVGGIMILSGVRQGKGEENQNPLEILQGILTNTQSAPTASGQPGPNTKQRFPV